MKKTTLPSILLLGASTALVLIGQPTLCDPQPWAENVCNSSVPVKKDIAVEKPIEYAIKVQSMCGILPCTKTRTATRMDHTLITTIQYISKATCCPGYAETPDHRCAPICLQSCVNGKCAAPGVCKCQPEPTASTPGFVGPTCSRFICENENKWGTKCDRDCLCSGNSYCGAITGQCICYPGWRGADCSIKCDADECEGDRHDRLPPIIEPDANLVMSENLVLSRQSPEALVLDDDVRSMAIEANGWNTTTYLVAILSMSSLFLLVAFLVVKRRYESVRDELYYSATGCSEGTGYNYSGGSPSAHYASPSLVSNDAGDKLEKNLSFTAATRQILLGRDVKTSRRNQPGDMDYRRKIVYDPRVESNLIESQRPSQHNVYSDVVLSMKNSITKQAPPPLPAANSTSTSADEHIYQVPKSVSAFVRSEINQRALDDNSYSSAAMDQSEDLSNIYEEIKPQK